MLAEEPYPAVGGRPAARAAATLRNAAFDVVVEPRRSRSTIAEDSPAESKSSWPVTPLGGVADFHHGFLVLFGLSVKSIRSQKGLASSWELTRRQPSDPYSSF